ncbi:MAG: hypothetical protein SFU99_17435 [Saprospiraceae bacterium]|nr:hypothetical protein [Saprospiraceae bacterium]
MMNLQKNQAFKNIEYHEGLHQLTIIYYWMCPIYYAFLFMGIIFLGVTVASFINYLQGLPLPIDVDTSLPMWFLLPLHIIVSIYLLYISLCNLLNETTIEVNQKDMNIRVHPIPCIGNRQIPRNSIKQLFIHQVESAYKGHAVYDYQVILLTINYKRINLTHKLNDIKDAQFIEQKIEQYLGIENDLVAGEYKENSSEKYFWG